jgi:hypothetical protein
MGHAAGDTARFRIARTNTFRAFFDILESELYQPYAVVWLTAGSRRCLSPIRHPAAVSSQKTT